MIGFLVIFACSLFMVWYSLAYIGVLPYYFEALDIGNNIFWMMLHGTFAKWALVFGVVGIVFALFGIVTSRHDGSEDSNTKFNLMLFRLLAFYTIYIVILIL